MYLDHFGLKEPPFRITPHTDFFFAGANRGATLDALLYAITHDEGIVKVTGEVGSGKTMLCRVLIERLPKNVETIYLANPSLSRDEILFAIGDELKVDLDKTRMTRVLRALQSHLIQLFSDGRRVVVLIDEAHAMPDETLEEIRLLSNLESDRHKLLQMVLFGQPELDQHLDTTGMRQLKERITHSFRLEPLVRGDVESYIEFRMRAAGYRGPKIFNSGAIRLVSQASEGLTRRINILADKALLAAFASGTHGVTEVEVKRAVRDSDFFKPRAARRHIWIGAAAIAGGLAVLLGVRALVSSADRPAALPGPAPATRAPSAPDSVPIPPPAVPAVPVTPTPTKQPAAGKAGVVGPVSSPVASLQPNQVSGHSVKPNQGATETHAETESALATKKPARPVPPAQGEIARRRFYATQDWLRTAPGDHYAIQLAVANSRELRQLEEFLLDASRLIPEDDLLVYNVVIGSEQHYQVAYGAYESAALAQKAIAALPKMLSAYRPYYLTIGRMRSQNSQ